MDINFLIFSLLEFLERDGDENLRVAKEIISEKFNIKSENVEYQLSSNLEKIFESGTKYEGHSVSTPFVFHDDEEYSKFIHVLDQNDYFKDLEVGGEEYRKRLNEANRAYLQRKQAKREKAEEFRVKGNEFMDSKKFKDAAESFKQATLLYPNSPVYLTNLAASLTPLKKYKDAIAYCDKAIEIDNKYTKAYIRKGVILMQEREYENAVKCFEEAKKLEPDDSDILNQRIQNARKMKRGKKDKDTLNSLMSTGDTAKMFTGGKPDIIKLKELMGNQEFLGLAGEMMNEPGFQAMAGSMLRCGENNNLGIDEELKIPVGTINELKSLEEVKNNDRLKELIELAERRGLGVILSQMNDPDVEPLLHKLASIAYFDIGNRIKKIEDE